MNWYDNHFLPWLVHLACSSRMVARVRRDVVPQAQGRVLEVGIGSGLNLPFYDRGKVEIIYGLEPSAAMLDKASESLMKSGLPVQLLNAQAEEIPLPDDSMDAVLLTFTLCTIGDWRAGLREMRRVLRPEGKLIFCEHGRAPAGRVRAWQRRINPYWRRIAGGCNLDRPIPELLAAAGFTVHTLNAGYLEGCPRLLGYLYRGIAVKGVDDPGSASPPHRLPETELSCC